MPFYHAGHEKMLIRSVSMWCGGRFDISHGPVLVTILHICVQQFATVINGFFFFFKLITCVRNFVALCVWQWKSESNISCRDSIQRQGLQWKQLFTDKSIYLVMALFENSFCKPKISSLIKKKFVESEHPALSHLSQSHPPSHLVWSEFGIMFSVV